jgi:hypothetical protein
MEGGDQSCIECEAESVAWVRVVGLTVGLLVVCLLVITAYLCYQRMAARGAKKDAGSLRYARYAPHSLCGKHQIASAAPALVSARVDCIDESLNRWVKPNFVSGGAVPLSIYGKVTDLDPTVERHSGVHS